jgi:asparagine synthase (glutamine-hydrolysing)
MESTVRRMSAAIAARGPDDEDVWACPQRRLALAHRRLSIIDLSETGRQPMVSADGRLVLVFNGEIYNHADLLAKLRQQGVRTALRGTSDTEVLLLAIAAWGLERALQECAGMFAVAVWDTLEHSLTLAVDRFGVKPLYWSWSNGRLVFGSTMAALYAVPGFDRTADAQAVVRLMGRCAMGAPDTIHRHVQRLAGGTLIRFDVAAGSAARPRPWWHAESLLRAEAPTESAGWNEGDWLDALHERLRVAVGRRMVSDVPIGAFLSGGIDSSTVVALMQAQSSSPVRTFTIGHDNADFNEAQHARAVAAHLGTDHTELYVQASDMLGVVDQLPDIYDEPFGDSSAIPTVLVSRLARQHVTVALSGDGGDEFFAGYLKHRWVPSLWSRLRRVPRPLRAGVASALSRVPTDQWSRIWGVLGDRVPERFQQRMMVNKIEKLVRILPGRDESDLFDRLALWYPRPHELVIEGRPLDGHGHWPQGLTACRGMMYADTLDFLQNDALVKVDRASMSCGLEAREPLLDHELAQFSWQLPQDMLIRDGVQKWALRQILYRYVPASLIERPKLGFGVPIGEWLRRDLRPWAEDLLSEAALTRSGVFETALVRQLWKDHGERRFDHDYTLWNILMFQAWFQRWGIVADGDG